MIVPAYDCWRMGTPARLGLYGAANEERRAKSGHRPVENGATVQNSVRLCVRVSSADCRSVWSPKSEELQFFGIHNLPIKLNLENVNFQDDPSV